MKTFSTFTRTWHTARSERTLCHVGSVIRDDFGKIIALIPHDGDGDSTTAIADLIGIAPELLKELEDCVADMIYRKPERFDDAAHQAVWKESLRRKRELIARANGENVARRKSGAAETADRRDAQIMRSYCGDADRAGHFGNAELRGMGLRRLRRWMLAYYGTDDESRVRR